VMINNMHIFVNLFMFNSLLFTFLFVLRCNEIKKKRKKKFQNCKKIKKKISNLRKFEQEKKKKNIKKIF
jgi:hypothetical protein